MPQMTGRSAAAALSLMLLAVLAGCSDPKNDMFDAVTGKHRTDWLPSQHAAAASSGTTTAGNAVPSTGSCAECHGADLAGGVSGVSCTACHLGGPTAVHPATWAPIYLAHGPSVSTGTTGTVFCANQYCHGPDLQGVADSGPACSTCHAWPWSGPASLVCGACHRIPPNGTAFPNIAGRHAKHAALAGITCDACHPGAGGYAGDHSNGIVTVGISSVFYSRGSTTAAYNPATGTCSNISCHGGPRTQVLAQVNINPNLATSTAASTPNWLTGTITVGSQCTACHVYGRQEHNGYWSGQHYKHVWDPNNDPRPKLGCTVCHDPARLSGSHFTALTTSVMEGPASATLRPSVNYTQPTCDPQSGGMTGCHGGENW